MKLKGEQYVSLELVSFSAVSEKGFEIVYAVVLFDCREIRIS